VQTLAFERTSGDGVEVMVVEGELDIGSAARLLGALNEIINRVPKPLVLDLSKVGFMDSTGLALLINARRRLGRRGHGFAVVCPHGSLRRVFEMADLVEILHVCPDRSSAARAATAA
jgi:anti-anti-sigma factor